MNEELQRREVQASEAELRLAQQERALRKQREEQAKAHGALADIIRWVAEKEDEFRQRFPDLAASTMLPNDEVMSSLSEDEPFEEEALRLIVQREALIEAREALFSRVKERMDSPREDSDGIRERLMERERAISDAVTAFFMRGRPGLSPSPMATPSASGGPKAATERIPLPSDLRNRGAEFRRDVRVALQVPINIRVKHRLLNGDTENLSVDGVFIRMEDPLPVGRVVDLTFDLPESEPLSAVGTVTWQRPASSSLGSGVGIRFDQLPPETRTALEGFVRRTGRVAPMSDS
jgi:uncharacterized protein (TIGR02266 family)